MKKFYKVLVWAVLVFALVLSATACTFIEQGGSGTENGNGESDNKNYNSQTTVVDTGDATIVYRKVRFAASEADYAVDKPLEETEAIKKAERSSVAISNESGAGSGVVVDIALVDDDGNVLDGEDVIYILTCHHMISDKGSVTVQFPDENVRYGNEDFTFTGVIGGDIKSNSAHAVTLVGGDLNSDIALLKINIGKAAKSGKVLKENDKASIRASKVKVAGDDYEFVKGEKVFSVGNPTGALPGTVSCGTISYLERETSVSEIGSMLLLQIDVTSNPGNSGGGLYNLYGELIGITNAGNTNYQNINFAIPFRLSNDSDDTKYSETANHGFKHCAEMLLSTASETNYGCVPGSKQKFGFTVTQQTSPTSSYIVVSAVTDGSLASAAGLKAEDVIVSVSVNGEAATEVTTVSEFSAILKELKIGDKFVINGKRAGSGYSHVYREFTTSSITCSQFWFCFIAQK